VQRYFDRDGNPCRAGDAWTAVTTRDSPWDEPTVLQHLSLARYYRECCSCGLHQSVLDDPDRNPLTFQEWTCAICRARAVQERVVADRHEKADKSLGEKPSPKTPRAADGHHMAMRRLTVPELLEREKRRGEARSAGGGSHSPREDRGGQRGPRPGAGPQQRPRFGAGGEPGSG
jgi:hypothetical protein